MALLESDYVFADLETIVIFLQNSPKQRQLKMAPKIQKPAPAFKGTAVVNGSFKEIQLSDYKGKYLVVFFYPLDL